MDKHKVLFAPEGLFGSGPASEIVPGLWQSGFPNDFEFLKKAGFDLVVFCARELQPDVEDMKHLKFRCGLSVVCAPMDDCDMVGEELRRTLETAARAASEVARCVREGGSALVTCAAGRNRSGLVSALSLVLLHGVPGSVALEVVKRKRAKALTNESFAEALRKVPAPKKSVAL